MVVDELSDREREVLDALGQRRTNAQIAQALHISVRTVESHVSSLLRKLGATDRRQLAALAPAAGSDDVEPAQIRHLPATWTKFVGREAVLAEIVDSVTNNRLVTVLGPGGMGKTRLATVAAERLLPRFAGGGAFVDLVAIVEKCIDRTVMGALDIVERPNERMIDTIADRLRNKRTLIVLDNCEHVLADATGFAQDLLAASPDVVLIATSRERLGVAGERVISVPPLEEAEQLFYDRAGWNDPAESEQRRVAEICRHLDGVPLAIELAAARVKTLGTDGLLTGLDESLRILAGPAAQTGRHRTMRAVIDWSHALLDDDERTLFRRIGVFAGAVDQAAITAVADIGDSATTSDLIGRLADKSLLSVVPTPTGSRWRMLETVHAYAHEQLVVSGEADAQRERHLRWAAEFARAIEHTLESGDEWQVDFDLTADDLRAALRNAPAEVGADATAYALATSLAHLTYARRHVRESRLLIAEAVRRAPDEASAIASLIVAADLAFAEMRGELAHDLLIEAAGRAEAVGDNATAAAALAHAVTLGGRAPATFVEDPNLTSLRTVLDRATALAPSGDKHVTAWLALAEAWIGGPDLCQPTREASNRALAAARDYADPALISNAFDAVASAASSDGHHRESSAICDERAALLPRLHRHDPHNGGEVADIFHMAVYARMGIADFQGALEFARREAADSHLEGLPHHAACHLIQPLVMLGEFNEALRLADVMEEGWRLSGRPVAGWMAPSFYAVALTQALTGNDAEYDRWIALGDDVCSGLRRGFRGFTAARAALHRSEYERAMSLSDIDDLPSSDGGDYYWLGVTLDAAAAAGADDIDKRLAYAEPFAAENAYLAACVARARARATVDADGLRDAAAMFDAIGAAFERDVTLAL
ncbi:MAG: hypothetical protein QOJ00_1290 [Actinomycetota bacterium]